MPIGQPERVSYPVLSDFFYRLGMAFPIWAGLIMLLLRLTTCNLSPANLFALWKGPDS